MLPDRVSNPGPLTYESGALPIALRGPAAIMRDFIIHHLDLDANNMYLSRAHRLGPRKIGQQNPKRPIIVNFRDFCDTEMIMGRVHMLKSTPFSICYDLPKEINYAH